MNVLLCIKQVPDTETVITENFSFESANTILNPDDEFALEQIQYIKKDFPTSKILAVRIGPEYSQDILFKALALGADEAHLLLQDPFASSQETTKNIFNYLHSINFLPDLILTGRKSSDHNQESFPQKLSALFKINFFPEVIKLQKLSEEKLLLESKIEKNLSIETSFPLTISCIKGLNEPKIIPLPKLIAAKKKSLIKNSSYLKKNSIKLLFEEKKHKVSWIKTYNSVEDIKELLKELRVQKIL